MSTAFDPLNPGVARLAVGDSITVSGAGQITLSGFNVNRQLRLSVAGQTYGPFLTTVDCTLVGTGAYELNRVVAGAPSDGGGGADLASAGIFVPPTDDITGILIARFAALNNPGGGTVKLKHMRYPSFGNIGIELVSGVSYVGEMPVIVSPGSGAPDIGAILSGGTILEADANTPVFYGRNKPGLEFTGTIVNGVLTVATTVVSAQTGVVGFLDAGSNIRQDGQIGANIFITAQLTSTEPGGELGKRGTYSVYTTAGNNITNPPAITAGNTWRCEYVSGVTIKDIGFVNAKHGVQLGAFGTQGGSWCHFENLHAYNTTGEPYDLLNFEHITVSGLYSFDCGHAPRLAMWAAAGNGGLGNSVIEKVYNYVNNKRFARGIILGSPLGNPGAGGNTIYVTHVQNNHFGRVALDVVFTLASGNASLAVPPANIGDFAVDMVVRFASSLGGFIGGAVASGTRPAYFVVAVDVPGNTIQLAVDPRGTAVVPNASGPVTTRSYGFPAIILGGSLTGPGRVNTWGVDMEGVGNTCLLYCLASCGVSEFIFTNSGEENVCIRRSSFLTLSSSANINVDAAGPNSFLGYSGAGRITQMSQLSGGNALKGVYPEGTLSACLNLADNRNSGGLPTLSNREPGNGAITAFGTAVAFRNGFSVATVSNINQGSVQGSYGNFAGTAPAVWSWTPNASVGYAGMRQVFKNDSKTAGATLTITLSGAAAGTFDGRTDGSSLGKSIVLQPVSAAAFGGCLVMVCMQTGASTYEWVVESLLNGALL